MENPNFLKKKYDLHNAPEVESAAKRTQKRTNEKVPQAPEFRIQNYLNRFKEIVERKDPGKREMGINALKHVLYDKFVIKPEQIPESYFDNQKRIAREQGYGDIEITEETKKHLTEVIITDQKSSLDTWVDYLSLQDAVYPDWLKYYAFRSVLNIGEYDKEKKQFTKRSNTSVKPFPDLNREALAYVLDVIEKKTKQEKINPDNLNLNEQQEFEKILQSENFAKLYAWAIEKITPASKERLVDAKGKWVKYNQGSDHMPLVESLQGHGTGWCTAGESTAQIQLQGGDFYVYYSNDEHNKPTIPRVAIRMQGNEIGEVRGVAPDQNLDPYINDVVKQKLQEFPDGKLYEKKQADMKKLTEIDNKNQAEQPLTKDDLIFLYEINSPIQGFGYQTDPRIEEIRKTRDPEQDAPIVFECGPNQIAHKLEDINQNTKAYIGPLFKGIFQLNLEYIYTSFPEGKIRKMETIIGGKTKQELIKELQEKKINISNYAKQMMDNKDFTTSKKSEQIDLIRLTVEDLGFLNGATTQEIYEKAQELGLELCPAETGPNIRLNYLDQPLGEWFRIAMKQITDVDGNPNVFDLCRADDGLWLDVSWANPGYRWDSDYWIVFRLSKFES